MLTRTVPHGHLDLSLGSLSLHLAINKQSARVVTPKPGE
jgi:hypothetical protein